MGQLNYFQWGLNGNASHGKLYIQPINHFFCTIATPLNVYNLSSPIPSSRISSNLLHSACMIQLYEQCGYTLSGSVVMLHGECRCVMSHYKLPHLICIQSKLPEGATLLSVILSSDKTNISTMMVIGLKIEYPWIIHFSLILYSN